MSGPCAVTPIHYVILWFPQVFRKVSKSLEIDRYDISGDSDPFSCWTRHNGLVGLWKALSRQLGLSVEWTVVSSSNYEQLGTWTRTLGRTEKPRLSSGINTSMANAMQYLIASRTCLSAVSRPANFDDGGFAGVQCDRPNILMF